MPTIMKPLRNEKGSVIVVAMIMLVLLTLIGISSTTTSTTEVQIAANNQNYQVEFYLADSGWRQGAMWLENRASLPGWVNSGTDDNTVKNYGSNTPADPSTTLAGNIAGQPHAQQVRHSLLVPGGLFGPGLLEGWVPAGRQRKGVRAVLLRDHIQIECAQR